MKRIFFAAAAALSLFSCSAQNVSEVSAEPPTMYVQDGAQLDIGAPEGYVPLNYSCQHGLWLPYMHFEDYMLGRSEEEFRAGLREILVQAQADGINTVYFHVHPCGDAYYQSDIFPRGVCWDGDYDPLAIALEEAHSLAISVHAWLNPLRCQTQEQMSALPETFIVRQWTADGRAKLLGERWYLDPSYPEVRVLVAQCADEILSRYDVDGIHIDDYFYPTADPAFDAAEFAASGCSDLAQWRLGNINSLVKLLYDTVKSNGSRFLFGISPQGNISADYSTQFADVRLWGSSPGYCDYLLPQIYYGFRNESLPFDTALAQWEELVSAPGVSLVAGLAAYKVGKEDQWAGESGRLEWIEDSTVLSREIEMVESSSADGYALYR
ncbi:MAG: family 10 glycosylhydrolase [Ruminococcus sp.]|nr:family 10 glycosylhydrolase [Ruminococcus sp.]